MIDTFRIINAVLGLLIAGGLMFDKYAAWRDKHSTQKLLTFTLAGTFVWQSYTSIEVVWLIPDTANAVSEPGDYGIRVFGFTLWFILVLLALLERHRRMELWETHSALIEEVKHES